MSKAETASLQSIHEQLATVLEDRVTELMTQIKSTQALTRQIARTEEEIERQRLLREKLDAELGPMREEAAGLTAEATALTAEVEELGGQIDRLKEIRDELQALQSDD